MPDRLYGASRRLCSLLSGETLFRDRYEPGGAGADTCGEEAGEVVPGATHLFEEPGALERVARLAAGWFVSHLDPAVETQ
ncbi:MAG: hypothetical protein JOZ19_12345 [Rubrobacter sp.]|nr:hypothetical protein [Rubrobacter sp.]